MNRWFLFLTGWMVCFGWLTAGCETREIAEPEESTANQQASPEVVFEDSFNRESLGEHWRRGEGGGGAGEWQIKDGWLYAKNIRNDPLWFQQRLPRDVRIEFKAKAKSSEGDIKVELFGDGQTHESGYILIFGGWNNRLDVIARLDEHGKDRKEQRSRGVEAGKVYEMAVERTDSTLKWFVDGELFMTYDDDEPLTGSDHRYFAFNNWTAPVRFDDFKVIDLGR